MNDMTPIALKGSSPKDWETDQEVRWCPGCGDYAVLKAVQRTMPELGVKPEASLSANRAACIEGRTLKPIMIEIGRAHV